MRPPPAPAAPDDWRTALLWESHRFWSCVEADSEGGCWRWMGQVGGGGYPRFVAGDGVTVPAGVWAFERCIGPSPPRLPRRCGERRCVNPWHAEPRSVANLRAIGARLRATRRATGLRQKAVAARAGLHPPVLSKLERGLARPGPAMVARLAHALGLAPDELARRLAGEG